MKKSTIRITGCYAKLSITRAFTMAEILISLTIIGIIAAITLPSLRANINEKTWATQRKALYSRMSQAIFMMPNISAYGINGNAVQIRNNAAKIFITDGLSKVFKVNNVCGSDDIGKCGFPTKIKTMGGQKLDVPTNLLELNAKNLVGYGIVDNYIKVAAFETANNENILVYYNPYCTYKDTLYNESNFSQAHVCANFIYDLNGKKGPNTFGKDIGFISVLYPSDSVVVAPLPLVKSSGDSTANEAGALCRQQDSESRLPNIEELSALFYNKSFINMNDSYWSSNKVTSRTHYRLIFASGIINELADYYVIDVHCVKR